MGSLALRLCATSVLLLPGVALAGSASQPADELHVPNAAADAHLSQGQVLYAAGDFQGSLQEFRAGYAIDPDPLFLLLIGQDQRFLNNCTEAVQAYQNFLLNDQAPDLTAVARRGLEKCAQMQAATVPAATPGEVPTVHFWRDPLGDALAGGSVASAIAGVVFLLAGNSAASAAQGAAAHDPGFYGYAGYRSDVDAATKDRLASGLLLGASAALLTGAIVRYYFYLRDAGVQESNTATAVIAPLGVGLSVSGTY